MIADTDYLLAIRVLNCVAPERMSEVEGWLDSEKLALECQRDGTGWRLTATIAARDAPVDRPVLRLAVPFAHRPHDRNEKNKDKRLLGMSVKWVRFAPA